MARFDPDLDGQTRAFPKMRKQTSALGCSQVDSHCEDCKRIKHNNKSITTCHDSSRTCNPEIHFAEMLTF